MGGRRGSHGVNPGINSGSSIDLKVLQHFPPRNGNIPCRWGRRFLRRRGENGGVRYRHSDSHVESRIRIRNNHILLRHRHSLHTHTQSNSLICWRQSIRYIYIYIRKLINSRGRNLRMFGGGIQDSQYLEGFRGIWKECKREKGE